MSFMISRETENIQSISEVEGAFRAITANGDKPYVTKDEIFQVKNFSKAEGTNVVKFQLICELCLF